MAGIDKKTYAAAKRYTDVEVAGGGAIKGKNCVVDSIMAITGGHRVTFKWTLDDGTVQTGYMDVMDGADGATGATGPQGPTGPSGADGADGRGIASVDVDANNHLIITYDDTTSYDAGEIKVEGQTIQRNVLPTASADELGKIYQYIGATDANYTNGYFYQCVLDGMVYKWEEKKVQSGGGSGVDKFKDLDDVNFSSLQDGDIPVYDDTTGKWKNSGQIPLDISALQGSMANVNLDITHLKASDLALRVAIHDLDLLVASKVDKEAGKGLSEENFTTAEKQKLGNLQPIYLIGSGLNLDGSTLKATGMSIPIDTELNPTSANPVQNKAIAVPVQALQGSMADVKLDINQLQGSVLNAKSDIGNIQLDVNQLKGSMADAKTDIGKIKLDVSDLQGSMATAQADIGNIQLDIAQLQGSMVGVVKDPSYIHTDNNFSNTDKANLQTNIPLDISNLQGSVLAIKLDVDHLKGSVIPLKADKTELDEYTPDAYANVDGEFYFDDLDDSLGYKFCGWDRLIRIERWTKTDPDPLHAGKVAVTYKTDAPLNARAALRILK